MFYCEPCAEKNEWPKAFWLPLSHGKCEICDEVSVCFDVPSRALKTPQCKHERVLTDGLGTAYCVQCDEVI